LEKSTIAYSKASTAHLKGAAAYKGRGVVVGTVAVVELQVITACKGKGATSVDSLALSLRLVRDWHGGLVML
jgi:hypothetical protein